MRRELIKSSKFLSKVLRHQPQILGLELDENGWTDIDAMLHAMAERKRPITREVLDEIVATNDKRRFSISSDGRRIRARQGHSLTVDLGLEPLAPPPELFHGTSPRSLDSIHANGLQRMGRHHVHLSPDVETARRVGGRRGRPVILRVRSGAMHAEGFVFFRSENGVWLTDHVPSAYVEEIES